VPTPLAGQPLAFELLDPVGGDLVQNRRPEPAIQDLNDLAIAVGAALVQLGVIPQIRLGEGSKRDVRLSPNAVTAFKDPRALPCFDVLGQLLVGRLRARPMAGPIHPEVVMPRVPAPRRGVAVQRVRFTRAQ
jgi:hypothetical protein